ncbi:MAG TPA: LLM class flavin-dependent oxidoreductase [Chloroflexota bacterium]|nr:LLM class flavin-dependent oxidoreductase [Chloroflexota bacterium]
MPKPHTQASSANAGDRLAIGLIADSPTFPGQWEQVIAKVQLADRLGFSSVWLGEAWGYELFTSLADLARATTRIKIGAGVANVFSRSPAVIASAAATIDERSNGRLLLGLGTSGPQVVEHWHGVPFAKPLRRLREYVEVINLIMRREKLVYRGEIFQMDRGFTLRFRPVRSHIPIYLASLGPRSIALTGALADGILPIHWPAADYPILRQQLSDAARAADRPADAVRIAPYLTVEAFLDESQRDSARRKARAPVAFYVGRMGTFYASMLSRHGFAGDVAAIQQAWQAGPGAASDAVSDELLDAIACVGTPAEIVQTLRAWHARGMDEPLITMPAGTLEESAPILESLAQSAELSST